MDDKIGLDDEQLEYFSDFRPQLEEESSGQVYNMDLTCPICLDMLHEPYWLDPCEHVFCEPCLRRLGGARINKCPMCRQPIRACHPDLELADSILQTFPGLHHSRSIAENRSNVRNLPLPPIRRSFVEIFSEFTEEYVSHECMLFLVFLSMILMQFGIMMALHILCHQSLPNAEAGQQLNLVTAIIKIGCCIFGFCRMRMSHRHQRPIILPLLRTRMEIEQ